MKDVSHKSSKAATKQKQNVDDENSNNTKTEHQQSLRLFTCIVDLLWLVNNFWHMFELL